MKAIKIIFITVEVCCIIAVVCLSFSKVAEENMGHYFHAAYISLLTILAVAMQKEQQDIEWDNEDSEDYVMHIEDVEL